MSKFYCGDKDVLPPEYQRRGSRRECLRKGVGVGLYIKGKEESKINELQQELKKLEEEKLNERRRPEERIYDQNKYSEFLNNNFDQAKNLTRNLDTGEIFKRLADLWVLSQELQNNEERFYTPRLAPQESNTS